MLNNQLPHLTQREQQVMRLVAEGKSNKAIGDDLGIAEGTVKVYMKRLFFKLSVRTRTQLASFVHAMRRQSAAHQSYRAAIRPRPAAETMAATPLQP